MKVSALELTQLFIEEAFNKGNLSALDKIIHPNYLYRSPGNEVKGIDELKAFISAFRHGFPDLSLKIDDQVFAEDKACTSFTLTGTHMEEFMGIPATNRQVNVHGIVMSRFQDNKILEDWEVLDELSLLQQLGVVPDLS
ncbi:conserved hypothetical protein, steroid delta-isomerase-related [Malonomonas rubra DSM 5091]|uniref:SnoaL-like polyketide cyclase n=1 Tax=Malonomonas rubra DSM 5091 TaxID=1122189 RepID=A0A1M6DQG3_MALRU|nr:ester cyclase [Malonomonas rubra]SHI75486.1 conserved hypothetical protein, steroid delta-isomerase-related [Malonomonas rubra DSM 5091]